MAYRKENALKTNKNKFPDGYLYFLKYGNEDIYKVGVSNKPKRRIRDIDSVSPIEIKPISIIWFKNVYEMEECIHENLKEYHLRGEWYKIPFEELKGYIIDLQRMSKNGEYLIRR